MLVPAMFLVAAGPALSTVHIVDDDGLADTTPAPACTAGTPAPSTVQDGLDNTSPGDTVWVCGSLSAPNGRYEENVLIDTDGVHLLAVGDSSNTVLHASNSGLTTLTIVADDVRVEGFRLRNGLNGLTYGSGSGGVLVGNRADSNVNDGFFVTSGASDLRLENNRSDANGGAGFQVRDSDSVSLVENRAVANTSAGIGLVGADTSNLRRNVAVNNGSDGILLRGGSDRNRILDNVADTNAGAGIGVVGSASPSTRNRIENNRTAANLVGLGLRDRADSNILNGNQTVRNDTVGLLLSAADSNSAGGNTIENNGVYGLVVQSGSVLNLLGANTVRANRFYGALVLSSSRNVLRGNVVRGHDTANVILQGATANRISRNDVQDTYGIVLTFGSNDNAILRNRVNFSDSAGILLDLSDNNRLDENRVDTNVVGFWFNDADDNRMESNRIRDNDTGIRVTGTFGDSTPSNVARFNVLAGNAAGIVNHTVRIFDARNNFWGDPSGPSGGNTDPFTGAVASGAGDAIAAPGAAPDTNVAFDPFLTASPFRFGSGCAVCGIAAWKVPPGAG